MGRERLSAVVDPRDRNTVAYHEGGHAIMALFTPGAMPIYKATIVPRGPALGLVSILVLHIASVSCTCTTLGLIATLNFDLLDIMFV